MNRIFLNMPKPLIVKYIKSHYKDLTEDDAIYLLRKGIKFEDYYIYSNNALKESSKVLDYIIDYDISLIINFSSKAFTTDIINKLTSTNYIPQESLVMSVNELLSNEDLRLKIIKNYPKNDIVYLLERDQFDETVLKLLEDNESFVPQARHFAKYPLISKSSILIRRAINRDPEILYLPNISNELVNFIDEININIDYETLKTNRDLRENQILMYLAFKKDPKTIVLFDKKMINNDLITLAINRGYVPKEEDFIESPYLGEFSLIMEAAINTDPKLIKYIRTYNIGRSLIERALNAYQLTEEDLMNNQFICGIEHIMDILIKKDSKFEIYSATLNNGRKEKLLADYLQAGQLDYIVNKPFLKSRNYYNITEEDIKNIVNALTINIDENNMDMEQEYFQVLNFIIDGAINIRYQENKSTLLFPGVVAISNKIKSNFKEATLNNDLQKIEELVELIYTFVNGYYSVEPLMEEDYIRRKINELYKIYLSNDNLTHEETSEFYNEILNKHEEKYKRDKKEEVIDELKRSLSLTTKKSNSILTSRKIQKTNELMSIDNYERLGITKDDLLRNVYNLRDYINSIRQLRKKSIHLTSENFEALEQAFIAGKLTKELAKDILKIDDMPIVKLIVNKYNKVIMQFMNKVQLFEDEEFIPNNIKDKLGFNYNNFLFGDKKRYYQNIAKLIIGLSGETSQGILQNIKYFDKILEIIPFADLLPKFNKNDQTPFSIGDLTSILSNYQRTKERILEIEGKTNLNEASKLRIILSNFDYLIKIANGYASSDDIQTTILGNYVTYKVHVSNSKKYYDFYLKVLDRIKGTIPPVSGTFEGFEFESGNYHDVLRLIIGKNAENSCIDLEKEEGVSTFKHCLLYEDGDGIIIKDGKTKPYAARILVFRQGNFVMLGPIVDMTDKPISVDLYYRGFLDNIGRQIIENSIKAHDNIDYVFLTRTLEQFDYLKYKICKVDTDRITDKDGKEIHADFEPTSYLIAASSEEKYRNFKLSDINYDVKPNAYYLKPRRKIKWNTDINKDEISRLRALRVAKEQDIELREEYAREYETFIEGEYSQIIYGEDWYLAVRKDGTIEELLVPTKDERSIIEFETAKEELMKSNQEEVKK